MAYRLNWTHANGFAECHEGCVEQEEDGSWISSMYWYAPHGDVPSNRELGAYPTKKLAMERLEREFEQAPGPPCRVLVKDGQKVIETSLSSQLFR
jgi:hypothetical protein